MTKQRQKNSSKSKEIHKINVVARLSLKPAGHRPAEALRALSYPTIIGSTLADMKEKLTMLGDKHKAIANWLVDDWSSDNCRVCVIEGFSGVGKTEVASEFERRVSIDARVDAPESGVLDDLMLDLSEQLAAKGHMELANAINCGKPTMAAFEAILLKPVCIVIDEFQRIVETDKGSPEARVAALIERISKRAAPGRLLLLSHLSLDKTSRWSERIAFKTLDGLSPEEGGQLLGQLLASRERERDIPPERRPEISRWLGGNPRAIRVLVGCLENEALDDLTGVVPEAWEARDQQVSQSLISKLERELLMRALQSLDGPSASTLEKLAVFRKSVNSDGITRMLIDGLTLNRFLTALSARFLLGQQAGWYSLNPIAREISLYRLKENPRATQAAHRTAAGYYTRHFSAKQIVHASRLGGAFVEARYHLVQANDMTELSTIAQRFGDHLRSLYGWTTPEAQNDSQRDELIGVLSAYLQDGGPKAMEYYLARLLHSRSRPGDFQRALDYARRSTGPQSPADAWVLRLRLETKVVGIESMLQAAQLGFASVPASANLFAVYQIAAELLALAGRISDAIDLIEKGISKIAPDKGLYSLYLAEAELLANTGEIDEAIQLLRRGLVTIPPEYSLFAIYVRAAQLLVTNKGHVDEALNLLKDGISRIPPNKSLSLLYHMLADTLADAGQRDDALTVLEEGLQRVPTGHDRNILQSALKRISSAKVAAGSTSAVATVDHDVSDSTPSAQAISVQGTPAVRRVCILAIGTEWESRHGGLSTFNRDLCIELAAAGHRVVCVVPDATVQERSAAENAGVHLISPAAEPGLEGTETLLLDTQLPQDFEPELIIGHDRKTGPHAKVLAQKFGKAKFVLFLHTRPEDIEWHKDKLGPDDAAITAERRKSLLQQLASSAALVVGVGPLLTTSAQTLVYLANPKPIVHRLDPGFRVVTRPSNLPPEIHCLLLGRAEDLKLKGLDIAAKALGEVTRRSKLKMAPRLIIRGAPVGTGQELRKQLIAFGGGKLDAEVRNYSPDVELLQQDILMASLVLMPSRCEGFGLVALEAIAAKTPVLVSDQSGLAKLLNEQLGTDARAMIIETREDLDWSAGEWERAIETVLIDRDAAFVRAQALQERLTNIFDWQDAIRQLEASWAPLLTDSC